MRMRIVPYHIYRSERDTVLYIKIQRYQELAKNASALALPWRSQNAERAPNVQLLPRLAAKPTKYFMIVAVEMGMTHVN